MATITKKACLGSGIAGLVAFVALAQGGCSDSSAGPSGTDAAALGDVQGDVQVEAGPPPPLGVPVMSCAGCPVCGGVLGSPTSGIRYCTQDCSTSADCPTGTACTANTTASVLPSECLKTCAADTDCTAPFICRSDLGTPGSFCWSPYPPVGSRTSDAGDASVLDAGVSDTGTPPPDTGTPPDAGASDASASDASDGG
jgi:hypothetical protein